MKVISILTITILVLLFASKSALATSQYGDILIFKNDTVEIFTYPLEAYFEEKGERTIGGEELPGVCSAINRGYVAAWEIKNNNLFLVGIQVDCCSDNPKDLYLESEFKSKRVFANWYSGEIQLQLGRMLFSKKIEYGSVYEKEQLFQIQKGAIIKFTNASYIEYAQGRIYPSPSFLKDTIMGIIYKNLDLIKLDKVKEDDYFELIVAFDRNGQIDRISEDYKSNSPVLSSILMEIANKSLKDFPQVMKVNHEQYTPPVIKIWFSGRCLKDPEGRRYGCEEYKKWILTKENDEIEIVPEIELERQKEEPRSKSWIYIVSLILVVGAGFVIFRMRKPN